jgi:hypothetical protein
MHLTFFHAFSKNNWFVFYETFILRSGPLDCTLLLLAGWTQSLSLLLVLCCGSCSSCSCSSRSSFPHLQIVPCKFNIKFFQRHFSTTFRSFLPSFDSGMAPKETKKDRERHLNKAEELRGAEATDAATDAPTDSPTDDDEPEEPLLYNAEGGLMRPRTSAAAAAAPINAVANAKVGASPIFSTLDSSDVEGVTQEKGSARASTGTKGTKAKRALTRSSRSHSKAPKKLKKSKKARRRKKESSSSSSSDDRRRGRGRSPSSSSSTSSSSGDSDWEEFYDNATVATRHASRRRRGPRGQGRVPRVRRPREH